ncbi:hypothetical protein K438DRAFT_1988428 [Mycena galopus ATCC 62051]|nr:hypothetical protein K438DRAFT_1988428 [Mycena galopus ATCC 62051]
MPSFHIVPLPSDSSLTHLRVFAVEDDGKPIKMTSGLTPRSFHQLVSSFPNLTHLDVAISERMTKYHNHLSLLTELRSLRVQEYRTRRIGPPSWPARLVFPPEAYIREFELFLPSLPQLAHIEIRLFGDTYEDYFDLDDFEFREMRPELNVEYSFSVLCPSSGAQIVLDFACVEDSYSKSRISTV